MMRSLASKLEATGAISDVDPEKATIRCLAHIIHLAVMAILVELGVVSEEEAESMPLESRRMTNDEAEAWEGGNEEADLSDDEIADAIDPKVDLKSVISKVSLTLVWLSQNGNLILSMINRFGKCSR